MGFDLSPMSGDDNRGLSVNAWNWRPTIALLRDAGLLDDETAELAGLQVGHAIAADRALRIAEFLDDYLETVPLGQRILYDGTVVAEDTARAQHSAELSWTYSTTRAWLIEFRDFCRRCGGFEVW